MTPDEYADFLGRLGHRVRRVAGVYWYNARPHVYVPFPVDVPIRPADVDASVLLRADGIVARYPCPVGTGVSSYRIACSTSDYGLHSLAGKARNQVRRGLERCEVRRLGFDELGRVGAELGTDTLTRQGRVKPAGFRQRWKTYCHEAAQTEGAEAWGAFVHDELAAFLVAFDILDTYHITILRSRTSLLRAYPNNALVFAFTKEVTAVNAREASFGLESLRGLDTLDHFKVGMGYTKRPIDVRIDFAPWLAALTPTRLCGLFGDMLGRIGRGERAQLLAGMFRVHAAQATAQRSPPGANATRH